MTVHDDELVVRLRAHADNFDAEGLEGFATVCGEAADTIERLSPTIAEGVLREALVLARSNIVPGRHGNEVRAAIDAALEGEGAAG